MPGQDPHGPRTPADIPDLTLTAFLLARVEEDEEVAREAVAEQQRHIAAASPLDDDDPGRWEASGDEPVDERTGASGWRFGAWTETGTLVAQVADPDLDHDTAAHIARWDPARVLAEVNAKRRVVQAWQEERDTDHYGEMRNIGYEEGLQAAVELLALPYVAHPDYRPEWHPDQHR